MRDQKALGTVIAVALLAVATCVGIASGQPAGKQPEMTPEQKAAMEAWMKVATPGEGHKVLEPMIGDFKAAMTMWDAPGAAPQRLL